MLFNSYIFILLFLPVTLIGYFAISHYINHSAALIEILIMSLVFYSYNNINYMGLLILSICINWGTVKLMAICRQNSKKIILIMGIICNIAMIFYFKYFNFFIENINWVLKRNYTILNVALPLGISFYTFQQISFLIDSYRGETEEYSFIEYAAFVCFFPQLVAGPIVLHNEIIPQYRDQDKWRFSHENFAQGMNIMAVGLFKKVIIADTFGKAVTWAWGNIDTISAVEIIIIMFAYTFQIYFDFSGYSEMAVGISKMFNISLPINFNLPYRSCSIIEFWKKWHITLTRFLRTYVYFPLGGAKRGKFVSILIY